MQMQVKKRQMFLKLESVYLIWISQKISRVCHTDIGC